jgi:FkbM family methyltransferase
MLHRPSHSLLPRIVRRASESHPIQEIQFLAGNDIIYHTRSYNRGATMSLLPGWIAAAGIFLLRQAVPRLPPGDRAWLARKLTYPRSDEVSRVMSGFILQAHKAYRAVDYNIRTNGEQLLLERLKPFKPSVVLDVGANVGDWSRTALDLLPEATVHAFEVSPATADELARKAAAWATDGRMVVNRIGLAAKPGTLVIYHNATDATLTTMVEVAARDQQAAGHGNVEPVTAPATTGDIYLDDTGIRRVDLLKIDVEGAEEDVLLGFSKALQKNSIDIVQFEYGSVNSHTGFLLRHHYELLEKFGYVLGRLLPEGVHFCNYTPRYEDFLGPNWIAVRRDRKDIQETLRGPPLNLA